MFVRRGSFLLALVLCAYGCVSPPPGSSNGEPNNTSNNTNNANNTNGTNNTSSTNNGTSNNTSNSAECGDGAVEDGEACDDGNTTAGDGCGADCQIEADWTCTAEPSACCFDPDGDGHGEMGACAGADCDESNPDVNEGAPEVCNGIDDNCDGAVDEESDEACYNGPDGTAGTGTCREGIAYCIDGALGPCLNEVTPSAEACNGLDDDCNGTDDDGLTQITCGVGACMNTVDVCQGGFVQQCAPGAAGAEVCMDGIDNDCNGAIDEGCDCVYVSPGGNDSSTGGMADPLRTINEAIQLASNDPQRNQVCVAANGAAGEIWFSYNENIDMIDGISVYGGYEATTWKRPNTHKTNIRSTRPEGLVFDSSITSPTVIDGFEIEIEQDVAAEIAVVTIDGAQGAILSNNLILGPFPGSNPPLEESYGVRIVNGATPTLFYNAIQGGLGANRTIGVYSTGSSPQILESCRASDRDAQGRCTAGCGQPFDGRRAIMGNLAIYPTPFPPLTEAYAVFLEDSPGALVDQVSMCAWGASDQGAGLKIVGDATGTVISRSMAIAGGGVTSAGIRAEDCDGAAPWIVDNARLSAEDARNGAGTSYGIASVGDCHPVIDSNVRITGGAEPSVDHATGILCGASANVGSRCVIVGNREISGSSFGLPDSSVGIRCQDGGCARIERNRITGREGVDAVGIWLENTSGVNIEVNNVTGGCTSTAATALRSYDSAARISNNVLYSGECAQTVPTGTTFKGVEVATAGGSNELDVHSNHIVVASSGGCTGTGIELDIDGSDPPAGPRGIFRNNLIDPRGCNTAYGVFEASTDADPRFFEHNAIQQNSMVRGYNDEGMNELRDDAAIDGMVGGTASGNTTSGCQNGGNAPDFSPLRESSPCVDAGTADGAPVTDFEGDPRPTGAAPDIGPDEYVP